MQHQDDNFLRQLFINDTPLIDVRAPVEFAKGAFPCAINLPLLDDEQRHQVGLCYKQEGQSEAICLGRQLLDGQQKQQRLRTWQAQIASHPDTALYCFRGGLRSQTCALWLRELGVEIPLIAGGYKALRQYLIKVIDNFCSDPGGPIVVVGGSTGTGKTRLLRCHPSIDLEGHARHRGSSFGRLPQGQPTQINFENGLAIALLKLHMHDCQAQPRPAVLFEDEGRAIGSLSVPISLYELLGRAPMVVIEAPLEQRIESIYQEYVVDMQCAYGSAYAAYLSSALSGIRKRLGGVLYARIGQIMEQAMAENSAQLHHLWIGSLLREYYDPMYDYQLQLQRQRIVFRGDFSAVSEYLGVNQYSDQKLKITS
jgi:tRNA 2-selenouridine synthase